MVARKISEGVYAVGAVDWDRRLFDELIPLPQGTTYNSYVVRGDDGHTGDPSQSGGDSNPGKTALIDTVDPTFRDVLLNNLRELGIKAIDYVVINHAEQDHSGTLPYVLEKYPGAQVICSVKCRDLLISHNLARPERIKTVNDGETLSLGRKTLKFYYTPWVHWPETMVTHLVEDKILFSCDLFGSHYAGSDLYVTDEASVCEGAKRYYAEIMMPFRTIVRKNLEIVRNLDVGIIAPSHGPLYSNPEIIYSAYDRWTSDSADSLVVIPYVSMHGSTQMMVNHLVDALAVRGVCVKQFRLSVTDIGEFAESLVDAATVVIATPTVLAGPHPLALYAAVLANALNPKVKYASVIGSYGWGGKTLETIQEAFTKIKPEILTPVLVRGVPTPEDFKKLDALADEIAKRHSSL